MSKNQSRENLSIIMMFAGVASIITAIIVNAVTIISAVGFFGAAQLNNLGSFLTIWKTNPTTTIIILAMFFGGAIIAKAGAKLSK